MEAGPVRLLNQVPTQEENFKGYTKRRNEKIQLSGGDYLPWLTILLYSFWFDLSSAFQTICRIYRQKVEFPDGHLACYEFVKVQEDSCFLLSK